MIALTLFASATCYHFLWRHERRRLAQVEMELRKIEKQEAAPQVASNEPEQLEIERIKAVLKREMS